MEDEKTGPDVFEIDMHEMALVALAVRDALDGLGPYAGLGPGHRAMALLMVADMALLSANVVDSRGALRTMLGAIEAAFDEKDPLKDISDMAMALRAELRARAVKEGG